MTIYILKVSMFSKFSKSQFSKFPRETYFERLNLIRLWARALGKQYESIKIEVIFAHVRSTALVCELGSKGTLLSHSKYVPPTFV